MAYGDIGAEIDVLEFDTTQGVDCCGVNVHNNVYVVASQGLSSRLYITTFSIDDAGEISDTVLATLELSTSWGVRPQILKIADTVFAIVYQGTNYHLTVETVSISNDGLTLSSIEELVIVSADCRSPRIAHVESTTYAVSYLLTGTSTITVSTIDIDVAGDVSAIIDSIDLTAAGSYFSDIAAVNETIFAVLYLDTGNGTTVATIEIAEGGMITDAAIDTQVIDAAAVNTFQGFTEALTGVFVITHAGTDLDGFVSTVTIDSEGEISTVVDTLEIFTADTTELNIIHIGNGICAITFRNVGATDGITSTVQTDASGEIGAAVIDTFTFEDTLYINGMLLPISSNIYAVFYGADGSDGYVKTFDISTPPPGAVHHEMIMGIGM